MKKNNAYSEFVIYTIVSIVSAAILFITMIVLTRVSSEAFFGKINKFITASNVVMSFACIGLDSSYIRFYYEPPENTNNKQLAWICIIPAITILGLIGVCLLLFRNNSAVGVMLGSKGCFFVLAFIITVLSQLLYRFLTIFFRMSSRVLSFSIINIGFVLLTKTIFIPIYFFVTEFELEIIIAAIILILFMLVIFIINMRSMFEVTDISFVKYKPIFRFALLTSPMFIIIYLNSYLPQIIISKGLGDDILGIYSAALLFSSAIQVLSTGFTTFWSPYMYKNYKTNNDTIKNIHDVVLLGCVLFYTLVLLFNDFIYLFIGKAFRQHQNILGMLLIYPIVLIIVETTSYGINIEKKNEISLIIYVLSTVINVILCILLVIRYRLDGIAFASMISAIFKLFLMTWFGQKYYKSINSISRTVFHVIYMIITAFLFYLLYDNRCVFVVVACLFILFFLIYDRKTLMWIKNSIIIESRKKHDK